MEKRIAPRRNTMIIATIVASGGAARTDCVIRNLSDTGAKLEVPSVRSIPERFDILVPGHRPQHCYVVWRSLRELGVQFY
ncbi:MAG: PilZ domain-containing protein [Devosia sp.]